MIKLETVLFASDDSEVSVSEAREYIKRMGLTQDDVKLVKREGSTLVISRKDLWE